MFTEVAKKEFGKWLQNQRESQNIKRSTVAKALGYKNLNKGCRRIVDLEKGEKTPTPEQTRILQATLQISREQWQAELKKVELAQESSSFYVKVQGRIISQVEQALANHAGQLLKLLPRIQETSNWRHIQLPGQKLYMAYIGGGSAVQLGQLLTIWDAGGLRTEIKGGEFLLTSGQCSPLSGSHVVDGFFLNSGERRRIRNLERGVATSLIGNAIAPMREGSLGRSSWSLPQLLSQIGIPTETANVFWQRELVGKYDFHTATLRFKGEKICFPLLENQAHSLEYADYSAEDSWGDAKTGGRIIIGDLRTGQLGSYQGEQYQVHTADGNWTLRPGCAINPFGFPTMHWSADIPPLVQVWLINQFGRE